MTLFLLICFPVPALHSNIYNTNKWIISNMNKHVWETLIKKKKINCVLTPMYLLLLLLVLLQLTYNQNQITHRRRNNCYSSYKFMKLPYCYIWECHVFVRQLLCLYAHAKFLGVKITPVQCPTSIQSTVFQIDNYALIKILVSQLFSFGISLSFAIFTVTIL